jgi:hypothetical protein
MYKAQQRKINVEVRINRLIFSIQLTPKNVILQNYVTEKYDTAYKWQGVTFPSSAKVKVKS